MKIEKYRKLTNEEIEIVIKTVKEFLKPINPEVEIDNNPMVIHCWHEWNNNREDYDTFFYNIKIITNGNEFKDFFEIDINQNIYETGWLISYKYFDKFDNDINSETGKNLWDSKEKIFERLKNDK